MYETIKEGKAVLRINKADKISRQMEVFYNPVMQLNRDITILLLQQFRPMHLCDLFAGSGVRSIRFAKELKYKSIAANDVSKKAVSSIKSNLKLNKINYNNKKIMIFNEDANLFLLNSKGFDYIDVDPFGTSNYYLDSSVKRLSRNGILAVTNTDTAALTGTYPRACVRKYWAVPNRDYMMHETGLRILIRKVQLIGMQYDKALLPIFSYFKNHYFRIFFQCSKGKKEVDKIPEKHSMFNDAGPLWIGNLWDNKLVNKMYKTLLKSYDKKNTINNNELLRFLRIIEDESKVDVVGYYDIHKISKKRKLNTMMKKEDIIRKIKKKSFAAANTHFAGTGVRSDISYDKLLMLLKE